jgi:hypothetical protein
MRWTIGTIGATLAIVVLVATSAAPAGAYVKIDNTGDGIEDVAYRWAAPAMMSTIDAPEFGFDVSTQIGPDWEDDWYEDYEEGDELDEDFIDEDRPKLS